MLTADERTAIASEAAGIIVGRVLKVVICILGIIGLITVFAAMAHAEEAKPKPIVKIEKPAKKVIYNKKKVVDTAKKPVINVYIESTERKLNSVSVFAI